MSKQLSNNPHNKIAIIGLGYVGLPLAVAFAKKYLVIGYDINTDRINELNNAIDQTNEVTSKDILDVCINSELSTSKGLIFTSSVKDISDCNIYIITVPTPVDKYNRPDLMPMISASKLVASVLKKGDIVIYESTVYPGVTEDEMVPILEKNSKLKFNKDFYCGYSPERINPGDSSRTVTQIVKVTSGSTPLIADIVDQLYKSIIIAGTYKAANIKVAEAAKVIENSQRDINIAFVNELSRIFSLLDIDTHDVLEAASTKWNFLKFSPGLVGGHCIGVDPYYLAHKAQEVGYHPEVILAGRRINDSMGRYIATEVVKLLMRNNLRKNKIKVLILGFTFKENCPDVRNTRVIDIFKELQVFGIDVDVYDPLANKQDVLKEYEIDIYNECPKSKYDAVILAVAHKSFLKLNLKKLSPKGIVYDVKGFLKKQNVTARL